MNRIKSALNRTEANPSPTSWKRFWRDLFRLGLLLLTIELILRIGPVHALLSEAFDSYENLLWYDDRRMPSYEMELSTHPGYTFWILGSSPVMTGLDPSIIQANFHQSQSGEISVQNYTFSVMTNLSVMARLADQWLLGLDHPKYIVIGISEINFQRFSSNRSRIEDSPLEDILIYQDGIEDQITSLLYTGSTLYRYSILARNATLIPYEETHRDILPKGGYTELPDTIDCETNAANHLTAPPGLGRDTRIEDGYPRFDQLLDAFRKHNVPILIAAIPIARCYLENQYGSLEDYRKIYHDPLATYVRSQGIPFLDLDSAYYELPVEVQNRLFSNGTHPNVDGAQFLSNQLAKSLEAWLAQF